MNELEMLLEAFSPHEAEAFHNGVVGLVDEERNRLVSYLLGVPAEKRVFPLGILGRVSLPEKSYLVVEWSKQITDELTGAFNRAKYNRDIEEVLQTAANGGRRSRVEELPEGEERRVRGRRGQETQYDVSLLCLDVDHFKSVNDVFGHATGDTVLQYVVKWVKESLRRPDKGRVYRYGGEEFTVILEYTDTSQGMKVAERIRENIESQLRAAVSRRLVAKDPEKYVEGITISIGVANYRGTCPFNDPRLFFKQADAALYEAKKTRNTVAVYTPQMAERLGVKL